MDGADGPPGQGHFTQEFTLDRRTPVLSRLTAGSTDGSALAAHQRTPSIEHQRAARARLESLRLTQSLPATDRLAVDPQVDKRNKETRYVPWNHGTDAASHRFAGNGVTTAKYDRLFVTFLPLFLFEMFSRVAYIYFLIQATLAWVSVLSPFSQPFGATAALFFVLLVSAIKAIAEDRKRQAEDYSTNNRGVAVYQRDEETGAWHKVQKRWADVRVGEVVHIADGELFPADLLCLHCDLDERICYVKTTNLDGETNLKVKRQLLDEASYPDGWDLHSVLETTLELECELPNAHLHTFRGKARVVAKAGAAPRIVPVAMNEILLRGCTLKNSHSILGLVVYAGRETRIQMNSAGAPRKIGAFDHFLNTQVTIIVIFQLGLCLLCAILGDVWRDRKGRDRYYLDMISTANGNPSSAGAYIAINALTFWVLFSYLVPISLFVTLEIVKFVHGFVFVNNDPAIAALAGDGEGSLGGARCRNSLLGEDLGMVDYIFSDKTGTLTGNEMRLRLVAIKGAPFGDVHQELEKRPELLGLDAAHFFSKTIHDALTAIRADPARWQAVMNAGGSADAVLAAADSHGRAGSHSDSAAVDALPCWEGNAIAGLLPYHIVDFLLNLALCHGLLVEQVDGSPVFQGPSPDEVALVDFARAVGFEFVSRSSSITTLRVLGGQHNFETLYINEFSSERQRMSVIVRAPDGTIRLLAKGADTMMLRRLRSDTSTGLLERVHDNLHFFATKGLRTLVVGTRILEPAYFEEWARRYTEAQAILEMSDTAAEECLDEIERELHLLGVTAIEDKLQDAVPESIAKLKEAGIKVWMITGDKQETAINIAVSCRLFETTDDLLICNATTDDAAVTLVAKLTDLAASRRAAGGPAQLVIDGKTLAHLLGAHASERALTGLGALCTAVVVCRASPSQKARVVGIMRDYELRLVTDPHRTFIGKWAAARNFNVGGKLLAIGDGANDVAMIQAADVGIGIAGKEGRQAVNNADYAVPQFQALVRLLLVHGQLSRHRLARLIKYSFYKNVTLGAVLFYFQIFNGFSGQTLIDDISLAVYNVFFTSIPIPLYAMLHRPCDVATLLDEPRTYNDSRTLTTAIFWKTGILHGFFDGALCFFIPYLSSSPRGDQNLTDVYTIGRACYIAILGVVTIEVLIVTRYWTRVFIIAAVLSYALVYPYMFTLSAAYEAVGTYDFKQFRIPQHLTGSLWFWLAMLTIYLTAFALRFGERSLKALFRPDSVMVVGELEVLCATSGATGACGGDKADTVRKGLGVSGSATERADGQPRPTNGGLHATAEWRENGLAELEAGSMPAAVTTDTALPGASDGPDEAGSAPQMQPVRSAVRLPYQQEGDLLK